MSIKMNSEVRLQVLICTYGEAGIKKELSGATISHAKAWNIL